MQGYAVNSYQRYRPNRSHFETTPDEERPSDVGMPSMQYAPIRAEPRNGPVDGDELNQQTSEFLGYCWLITVQFTTFDRLID